MVFKFKQAHVATVQLYADLQEQTSGKMKTMRQDETIETPR